MHSENCPIEHLDSSSEPEILKEICNCEFVKDLHSVGPLICVFALNVGISGITLCVCVVIHGLF